MIIQSESRPRKAFRSLRCSRRPRVIIGWAGNITACLSCPKHAKIIPDWPYTPPFFRAYILCFDLSNVRTTPYSTPQCLMYPGKQRWQLPSFFASSPKLVDHPDCSSINWKDRYFPNRRKCAKTKEKKRRRLLESAPRPLIFVIMIERGANQHVLLRTLNEIQNQSPTFLFFAFNYGLILVITNGNFSAHFNSQHLLLLLGKLTYPFRINLTRAYLLVRTQVHCLQRQLQILSKLKSKRD